MAFFISCEHKIEAREIQMCLAFPRCVVTVKSCQWRLAQINPG
jgi:hypothetical protein